ncbi:MAG TPA: hypothetical protein PK711_02705 [Bacteroidales bacterium]|nr:hypothetical protein [Bacteroidales bacterium]HRZ22142.1 hypothetical protein [Bacteroidales bacterium]
MKRFVLTLVVTLTVIALSFNACQHEPDETVSPDPVDTSGNQPPVGIPCDPDTVYFANTIGPLLLASCGVAGCHDAGTAQDGVVLTDYAQILSTAGIKPGNPTDSELYEVITENDPEKIMPPPPRGALTSEQIDLIYKWILQGAKNNSCSQTECDTINITYALTVRPILQNSCLGCHSGAAPSGGIRLETHSDVLAVVNNGKLLGTIRHEQGYSAMPKNGAKLDACYITQIEKWIKNGAPNN